MSTTIGCPIPGASQPKPKRLIDADELLKHFNTYDCAYDGGEFQAYESCMRYVRDLVNDLPTIDPESLWPTAHWISVKDRPPEDHVAVFVFDSVCRNIYKAWMSHDLGEWFSEEYLPDFLNITHWMPLPEPPKETHND